MADDVPTATVIVALPAAGDPVHGIGEEQKHATLVFLGKDLGADQVEAVRTAVTEYVAAGALGPFPEKVTGVETLGEEGARVWMLASDDGLTSIHDELAAVPAIADLMAAAEQFPTYTPHVTIGYPTEGETELDEATETAAAGVQSISFDRIALWSGTDQTELPLAEGDRLVTSKEGAMPKPLHESTGLLQAPVSADAPTRRPIQIITPGWGSSGYYSAEVLERAAANRVIPAGTHMYLNHASNSEQHDRPERDVEKIGAVLVEDARWDGRRLVADAELIGPHSELIESLAPYIGVSIDGSATDIVWGEAEGRPGKIIEDLAFVNSVDFVTHAGRGGMVLLESARPSLVNARAVAHGVTEVTVNDTREQLQTMLRDTYGGEKSWVWVRDFDETTVWYEHETPDSCGTYSLEYSIDDDSGEVTLSGSPTEVRAKTTYVPATRPDSTTTTTEETTEVTMGKIQIEESEHNRLVEEAGRVDTLEAERDTEKARADAAEQKLAEAAGAAAGGGDDPTKPVVTGPRAVVEKHIQSQDDRIARLEAREGARQVVAEVLAEAWIGDAQKARLSAALMDELPMTEEGKLDEPALRTRATERVNEAETEAAEILSAAGVGTPRGLGALTTPATETVAKQHEDSLRESFIERGLSEAAADLAVKGR